MEFEANLQSFVDNPPVTRISTGVPLPACLMATIRSCPPSSSPLLSRRPKEHWRS